MENWDTDEDGNIVAHPFFGYESAIAPDQILLRLMYYGLGPDVEGGESGVLQCTLSPDIARKLANDLLANAERAEERQAEK
ncbi:MAG: hypothetical protein AAFW97_02995 [Pseudomonadota bacterium]